MKKKKNPCPNLQRDLSARQSRGAEILLSRGREPQARRSWDIPPAPSLGSSWHPATALSVLVFPRSREAWWGPGCRASQRGRARRAWPPRLEPYPAFPGNVTWEATPSWATRTPAVMSGQQHTVGAAWSEWGAILGPVPPRSCLLLRLAAQDIDAALALALSWPAPR